MTVIAIPLSSRRAPARLQFSSICLYIKAGREGRDEAKAMTHASDPAGPETIWLNARLATLAADRPGLGVVERGAVAAREGRIVFVGEAEELPAAWRANAHVVDCEGRWITPALIDCHTHLVHAGDRAREFEMRLAGASYEEIARAGGGIVATVEATRAASEDELLRQSLPRLDALIAEGVGTVEVKSGYGLELAAERKSLRVARRLAKERRVAIRTTFLGAHAAPPDRRGERSAYVAEVADEMLPALAAEGLIDAVDGFCERIAFTPEEIARVFAAARAAGLPVKLHADQLSNGHGAALAAEFGALSADHLEYADEAGVAAMARAGVVATLLPGAYYMLRERHAPPVELFRRYRVPMAVATDCNPGTSPLTSPLLALNMAATLFGLTVDECLAGFTRNAARALGLAGETGALEVGHWADLAIWDIERPAELVYRLGFNPLHARVWRGE
jgi:imidazolonepropionase